MNYLFTEWKDPRPEGTAPIPSDQLLTFWTPILGPSCVLVMRTIAMALRRKPELRIAATDLGALVGLKGDGRHSALVRSVARLDHFGFLRWTDARVVGEAWEARLTVPALRTHQFDRLPSSLKLAYGMHRERTAS